MHEDNLLDNNTPAMPDISLYAPPPPRPFVGRDVALNAIQTVLERGELPSASRPIVIRGEAGVGKTALAAAVCEQIGNRARPVWVPCRDWEAAAPPLERLMRERFMEVREAIVVFDGADDVSRDQLFEMFFRVTNFKLVRNVLVTSRIDLGLRGQREVLIERLSSTDSETLLRQRLSSLDLDETELQQIVSSINGHPLAAMLVSQMAKAMTSEQLRRVLSGNLYTLGADVERDNGKLDDGVRTVILSTNEAVVRALQKQPADVHKLTPRQYEELIAELLRDMGYDITLTPETRDGGKDILASLKTEFGELLCLVDAKKYRSDKKIGVSMVRTLYGTLCDYQASSAMLVTTATFSRDAHAMQERHRYQLSLRDYTDVAGWIQKYGRKNAL